MDFVGYIFTYLKPVRFFDYLTGFYWLLDEKFSCGSFLLFGHSFQFKPLTDTPYEAYDTGHLPRHPQR